MGANEPDQVKAYLRDFAGAAATTAS